MTREPDWTAIHAALGDAYRSEEDLTAHLGDLAGVSRNDAAMRSGLTHMAVAGGMFHADGSGGFVKDVNWRLKTPQQQVDEQNRADREDYERRKARAFKEEQQRLEEERNRWLADRKWEFHDLFAEYLTAFAEVLAEPGDDLVAEVKERLEQMRPPTEAVLSAPPVGFGEMADLTVNRRVPPPALGSISGL
jgi:hypothetical protein